MAPQKDSSQTVDPQFSSEALQNFLACHSILIISPHPPITLKTNGFTERQIKTIKTALDTAKSSDKSLYDLIVLRSTPIGPHLPSPREILHT